MKLNEAKANYFQYQLVHAVAWADCSESRLKNLFVLNKLFPHAGIWGICCYWCSILGSLERQPAQ